MNVTAVTMASFIASEMRASSPYRTGNMQRSIVTVVVDDNTVDVIVAVDYASYVNDKGKHKDWIKNVVERCVRCIFGNDVDDGSLLTGISYDIINDIGKG